MKLASLTTYWQGLSTLSVALIFSVGVHAALLVVRIVDPARFERLFTDTPLEVVLVNAGSLQAPEKAQALAQRNLDGGGEHDKGLASSPLPPSALALTGDALEDEQRRQEAIQAQQNYMVAQIRKQLAQMNQMQSPANTSPGDAVAREQKRRQLLDMLAAIEKRIAEENARPKKRYISPSTREVPYAVYYDSMRRKIEDKGTENFPEQAGKKMYGELVVSLTIDDKGRMVAAEVEQTSGNATLDRRAIAIAKAASPFGAFSAGMAKKEHIVVVAQFKFTHDETLETQLRKR